MVSTAADGLPNNCISAGDDFRPQAGMAFSAAIVDYSYNKCIFSLFLAVPGGLLAVVLATKGHIILCGLNSPVFIFPLLKRIPSFVQPDGLRGNLYHLVVFYIIYGLFEGHGLHR
jgi:hypothetical protein